MREFQVMVFGTADLMSRLRSLQRFFVSPRLRAVLEDAKSAYVTQARMSAVKKTRYLSRSIDGVVENFGTDNVRVRVFSSAKYAGAVEFGAKPHDILPRRRRWLHWFEDGAGNTLQLVYGLKKIPKGAVSQFRRVSHHPGNPAQPFFFKHAPIVRTRLLQALEKAITQTLSK